MTFELNELEGLLVCPKTRAKLITHGDRLVSVDPDTRLQYEIRDGIPIMIVEEATQLSPEDWANIMRQHGRETTAG